MSDADCTPGREPRSVAASFLKLMSISDVFMRYYCNSFGDSRVFTDKQTVSDKRG